MKTAFIALTIVMILVIAAYAWFNRGSDRIVLTFFTAMFAGAIGFTAKEAISNKTETRREELSVVALYSHSEYQPIPLRLPYFTELSFFVQALPVADRSSNEPHIDISHGADVYFPAVAYAFLSKSFSPFTGGWDSEVAQFSSPEGTSTESRGGTRTGEQVSLQRLFDVLEFDLQLADGQQAFRSDPFQTYYLPPKTNFRLAESTEYSRQLVFENRYRLGRKHR